MAAIAQEFGYFFNSNNSDRKYNAESFEEWLKPFFISGVFTGSLEVTELDTPGMGVKVNSGYANLDGKVARWTSNNTIAVATASGVYDRIDTIVLRRDNTNRQISLEVVTGVASASPQPTAPTRDSDTFELVLAQIYVGMGETEITQSDITDTRLDPDLCGYVCAAVQSPDFSDLYDQFTAQFMVWFDHMKDQLDDDAAGHLQLEIDAITANIGTVPPGKTLQGEIEAVAQIDDDLGIVVRNNKIAKAGVSASEGQYIILRESTIAGCADGLYKATQAIPANTAIDATYLTAVSGGGLNDLNNNSKPEKITLTISNISSNGSLYSCDFYKVGYVGILVLKFNTVGALAAGSNITANISGINIPSDITFYANGYSGTNVICGHITKTNNTINVLMRSMTSTVSSSTIVGFKTVIPLID